MSKPTTLAIIVSGSPAPGLNCMIESAVRCALREHWNCIGFHDGYNHLASGDPEEVKANTIDLTLDLVTDYATSGGSLIRTSRMKPRDSQTIAKIVDMLHLCNVRYLLCIGGLDKIDTAFTVTQGIDPTDIMVIAVPMTIDNDIPLPRGQNTFGFQTARSFGTELTKNLIVDAKSAPRWFLVEAQGYATGHLALAIASSSAAHLVLLPEDFKGKATLKAICDYIEGAIIRRLAIGKNYGVVVISEGLTLKMEEQELRDLFPDHDYHYNVFGRLILDDADLSRAIRTELDNRMKARGLPVRINPKKLGYELRCMTASAFDEVYTTELGYGAIEGFKSGHSNCMVVWNGGEISYQSFQSMIDPETRLMSPRMVDTTDEEYRVTKEYTMQLRKTDFEDPVKLEKLAKAGRCTPEEFKAQFEHVPDSVVA